MLMAVLFQSCSAASKTDLPKVENGVIDLREFELDDRLIQLDGTWEFYWQKLLAYEELSLHTPDLYAEVPKVWNTYSINGKSLPGEGYGTYRLRVNTNLPEGTILGLDINTFSSAYKLFINEKEVAANGTVADNPKEEVGEYNPKVTFFEIPEDTFDIVIMVSNYE